MKRRQFLGMVTGIGLAAQRPAEAASQTPATGEENLEDVNPYLLDPGDVPEGDVEDIENYIRDQQEMSAGSPVRLRGRPERAPTYRFLKWEGALGDPQGRFVGPLSIRPRLEPGSRYRMNAQIMNFNPCTEDWTKNPEQGALTIELRALVNGQPKTWMYMQQFEVHDKRTSTLGLEYIAQNQGLPDPLTTDQPNIGLRVQLIRTRKEGGFLKKILSVTSVLAGTAAGAWAAGPLTLGNLLGQAKSDLTSVLPSISVPEMPSSGVNLARAVLGSSVERNEVPLWNSGFANYGLVQGGSRIAIDPGFWVVMDERRQEDLTTVRLEDVQGIPVLSRNGAPLDMNYLVLSVEVDPA